MTNFFTKYYYFCLFFFILLIISASFYVGLLFGEKRVGEPILFQCTDEVLSKLSVPVTSIAKGGITEETQKVLNGAFVGSKNGTKYYRPHCGAVKRIKTENYKWFKDAQEAQLQGYTAGSC